MRHLHILCEGQTEEIIASDVLQAHFASAHTYVTWSVLATKRPAIGPAFKGGVSTWPKLARELHLLLHDSSTTALTTLLDYYAFPPEAPGMVDRPHGSPLVIAETGLGAIRDACPHADDWLRELEARLSRSVTE